MIVSSDHDSGNKVGAREPALFSLEAGSPTLDALPQAGSNFSVESEMIRGFTRVHVAFCGSAFVKSYK